MGGPCRFHLLRSRALDAAGSKETKNSPKKIRPMTQAQQYKSVKFHTE